MGSEPAIWVWDVPPQHFLERLQANPPDIVGLSGLIALSHDNMKETVKLIREHPVPNYEEIPILIGGGTLTKQVAKYVGADYWKTDAIEGVRVCQKIMQTQMGGTSPS